MKLKTTADCCEDHLKQVIFFNAIKILYLIDFRVYIFQLENDLECDSSVSCMNKTSRLNGPTVFNPATLQCTTTTYKCGIGNWSEI